MNCQLQVNHLLHVLIQLVRILIHQLFKGFAVNKVFGNGPAAVFVNGNCQGGRNIDSADLFDPGADQGFVQYFCFGESCTEGFDCLVTVTVNAFGRIFGY